MKTMNEDHRGVIDTTASEMHTSLGEIMANNDGSLISSFYHGKSIFITGASGFMGKVLVEKLLRSCSDLKSIFILLRTKKNVDPRSRLNELLKSKIFDRVREINANLLSKVIVIPGDIVLPGLGISNADTELLIQEVSVVFHSAATVKFDEPMRTSINFNALGTRNILELCRKMKKLESFVHVSTAYSNCDRHDVDEQFYPVRTSYRKVIELNEWMDDETLAAVTPKLLGKRPNTYTYTKALAEMLLFEESDSLPVAIVRPSIVTSAWREPYPGWVDNINGPTGMVLASGKGLLRTMLYDVKATADVIPVDMVINLMITVAWYTAMKRPNNIPIYNCTSGSLNILKWRDIELMVFPLLIEYPSVQVFRYPGGKFKQSRLYNQICTFFDHLIPAYIFDGIRWLCFRKPMLVRLYQRLHRATQALEYFTTRDWNFKATNVIELANELKGIDQKEFQFDVRNLDWPSYWKDYVIGIRKFILKEEDSTLPKARQNLKKLYYIQNSIYLFMMILLCYFISNETTTTTLSSILNGIFTPLISTIWPGFTSNFVFNNNNNNNNDDHQEVLIAKLSTIINNSTLSFSPLINQSESYSSSSSTTTSATSSTILSTLASYLGFPVSLHTS